VIARHSGVIRALKSELDINIVYFSLDLNARDRSPGSCARPCATRVAAYKVVDTGTIKRLIGE